MNRTALAPLAAAALLACHDLGVSGGVGRLAVSPVLDSVYVGDRTLGHQVTYYDANGNPQPAGPVVWASTDTTIAQVDNFGRATGRKRGAVVITAQAQGVTGQAFVVVSDTLDITLLLDTVYVMPKDTITVPVVVLKRNPPAAAVWYKAPPSNGYFTIDSASGLVTALAAGGPTSYIVHADSLTATGAVYVVSLSDTTGGKVFFSVLGTAITHVGGPARAANYHRTNGHLGFQLRGTYPPTGLPTQVVHIILPDSVLVPGRYAIDSLNPAEDVPSVGPPVAVCSPPRAWAIWQATNQFTSLVAYSRSGGTLGITQLVPITNGNAISGRFTFTAQRADLYTDPLGALSVHGSFVAPFVTDLTTCR